MVRGSSTVMKQKLLPVNSRYFCCGAREQASLAEIGGGQSSSCGDEGSSLMYRYWQQALHEAGLTAGAWSRGHDNFCGGGVSFSKVQMHNLSTSCCQTMDALSPTGLRKQGITNHPCSMPLLQQTA